MRSPVIREAGKTDSNSTAVERVLDVQELGTTETGPGEGTAAVVVVGRRCCLERCPNHIWREQAG